MKFFDTYKTKFLALFKKRSHTVFHRDPYADWFKVLIIISVLFVVVVIADGYLFLKISRGEIFVTSTESDSRSTTIDRTSLKKANDFYDAKEAALIQLKMSQPTLIDPSL
jgi:hypothetical protein